MGLGRRLQGAAVSLPKSTSIHLSDGCSVDHLPGFLEAQGVDTEYLRDLWKTVVPRLEQYSSFVKAANRDVPMPRLEAIFGDQWMTYKYSGVVYQAQPFRAGMLRLFELMQEKVEPRFNACFVNLYRDGSDSIGWHADDEPNLGPSFPEDITIASISLGETRRFRMKPQEGVDGETVHFDLAHGDLLLMHGATQRDWVHCITKTKKPVRARMNFTFRVLVRQ